jgi:site-specific recombinase XerD
VKLSGIKKNVSPHKLRHTFATTLHNQSVDLLEIKTLLGHQNISTTQIYTNTNPSRLRAAVNKLDHMTGSGNT